MRLTTAGLTLLPAEKLPVLPVELPVELPVLPVELPVPPVELTAPPVEEPPEPPLPLVPVANSRYLAAHLPAARYAELDGTDHPPWLGDTSAICGEVDRFLATDRRQRAPADGLLLALIATATPLDNSGLRIVERFRGRPSLSPIGTLYTFDGPVRAAACALALAGPEQRVAVHAGEIRYTPQGLQGSAVDVVAALLIAAPPGRAVASTTLRDLALGSRIDFTPAHTTTVPRLGAIEVLHLAHEARPALT